jgi:AcrR family transcriptional regulator
MPERSANDRPSRGNPGNGAPSRDRPSHDLPSHDLPSHNLPARDLPGRDRVSGPGGVRRESPGGAQPPAVREFAQRSSIQSSEPARRRVAPLAPDDRRAALVEATVPLLIENGSAISTRQIAQAAGVAEGTIFRVFPDKNSLILAAIRRALDPERGENALRAIPADLELRERVTQAAAIMLAGLSRFGRLHMIARELIIDLGPASDFGAEMQKNNLRIQEAMASVFEPDAARLRLSPSNAARLLMLTIVGMSGFAFGEVQQIDPAAIVAILFDGLVLPPPDANENANDAANANANDAESSTNDSESSTNHPAASTNEESSRPGHSKESTC